MLSPSKMELQGEENFPPQKQTDPSSAAWKSSHALIIITIPLFLHLQGNEALKMLFVLHLS
jgi:hypothetical protein